MPLHRLHADCANHYNPQKQRRDLNVYAKRQAYGRQKLYPAQHQYHPGRHACHLGHALGVLQLRYGVIDKDYRHRQAQNQKPNVVVLYKLCEHSAVLNSKKLRKLWLIESNDNLVINLNDGNPQLA